MAIQPLPTSPSLLLEYLHTLSKEDQQHRLTTYTRALAYLQNDRASLQIFLEYMEMAIIQNVDIEDIEHIYSVMKVKLRAFREYWESYIEFEVNIRKKERSFAVSKAVGYLRIKVFPGKEELIKELSKTVQTDQETEFDRVVEMDMKDGEFLNENTPNLNNRPINNISDSNPLTNNGLELLINTPKSKAPESVFEIDLIATQNTLSEDIKRHQAVGHEEVIESKCGRSPEDTPNHIDENSRNQVPENNRSMKGRESCGSQSAVSTGNSCGEEKEPLFECSIFEDTVMFNKKGLPSLQFKGKELFKINRIGKGGYSEVYRVLLDGEIYALKQMRVVDKESMRACKGEIILLEKLKNHDFVIKMMDYEVLDGNVNILLEYGEIDLQKMISSRPMNIFMIKYIWESILQILVFIHGNRIVHRDIKPANFVLARGRIKLIDFGISKSIRADTTSIINTEKAGTLNYISPEQCTGKRVGRASDVWSAGCILYNMVYRKNVHPSKSVMDVVRFMSEESTIEFGEADELAIESMKMCLIYDPKKRAKPEELLNHPFLSKK